MKEKAPLPSAVVVPREVLPLKTSTVLFISAEPVIVGVVSLVVVAAVVNDDGALGAVVSTVIDNAEEAEDVLPAASVAVAVME